MGAVCVLAPCRCPWGLPGAGGGLSSSTRGLGREVLEPREALKPRCAGSGCLRAEAVIYLPAEQGVPVWCWQRSWGGRLGSCFHRGGWSRIGAAEPASPAPSLDTRS